MKRRDLKDILREIQKDGVKEPETIRQYMRSLGDRTLYSLMYGDKEHCSEEERYECWSYLEFVFMAYTYFWDFTDEEITWCMKHITYKDFLCLIDHLDGNDTEQADCEEEGIIRNDFGLAHMREMALGCLLKLILRAKGRNDQDVCKYCIICVDSIFGTDNQDMPAQGKGSDKEVMSRRYAGTDGKKKKLKMLMDCFYLVKDRLDLDNGSWMSLDLRGREMEFGCLQELIVECVEDFCFGGKIPLTEVFARCEMMRGEMHP